MYVTASESYQGRIVHEAQALCDAGLVDESERARLIYLRGLLAAKQEQWAAARACATVAGRHLQGLEDKGVDDADLANECDTPVEAGPGASATKWLRQGVALEQRRRYEGAAAAYSLAVSEKPDCCAARVGAGHAYLALGEPQRALPQLDAAIALCDDHQRAYISRGVALYHLGELERAWDDFTWQYRPQDVKWRNFEQPLWDGSPIAGRTILLWTDQGLGDVVHFLRYVPFLVELGAHVIVECRQPDVLPLVEHMGVARVVSAGAPLPAFDVHAPVVMFPALLPKPRAGTVGQVPYLRVDAGLRRAWRRRLQSSGCRTIGLCWATGVKHKGSPLRSLPLAAFAPLAEIGGLRFVSLQLGPQEAELLAPPAGLCIERVLHAATGIVDTAAVIENLDLVISVDTMVAHLAGALGRPVWTLLRYSPSWLWRLEGEGTPWYQTMRLFRQRSLGAWDDVIERVRRALWTVANVGDVVGGGPTRRDE